MDKRFCEKCGKKTTYRVSSRETPKSVKGVNFSYTEEVAHCSSCNELIFVPEIHDRNIDALDAAYQKAASNG